MEKILKVMELCYKISNETKVDAFFYYAPHTQQIDVDIHYNGWINEDDMIDEFKRSNTKLSFNDWKKERNKYKKLTHYINKKYEYDLDEIIKNLENLL